MNPTQPISTKGLSPWQVVRLRIRLRAAACSETWVDDQIVTRLHVDTDGDAITLTLIDPRVFPPGGRQQTGMKWCRCCGRYTPPQAVSLIEHRRSRFGPVISATLHCDDCRINDDATLHRELYEAFPHIKPAGSQSIVSRRTLHNDRQRRTN